MGENVEDVVAYGNMRKGGVYSMTPDISRDKVTKEAIIDLINYMGGEYSPYLSKKVDYLIYGNDDCEKMKKANELGIKVLSMEEFENGKEECSDVDFDIDKLAQHLRKYYKNENKKSLYSIASDIMSVIGMYDCISTYVGDFEYSIDLKTKKTTCVHNITWLE